MAEVKVLVEGVHNMIGEEKLSVGSSTTLIKTNTNIIVDPGSFVNKDKLLLALNSEGLETKDIDAIILTHSHIDHTTNIFLFPHARIYWRFTTGNYPGQFQNIDLGKVQRFNLFKDKIADDVQVIETVGHSIDHISVLVETVQGKVIIAGDAVAGEAWRNTNKQPEADFVYSIEKYNQSRDRILELADYIIPGHGSMFKV